MSPVDRPGMSLFVRDAVSNLKSAPETLSSWDKCMAKPYCKWPVIVAIIVGAVIVIAVLACIINCLCCGIQCCTGCCRCLTCCCPSPRNKRSKKKYMDDPSPYHQPPPPPMPATVYQPPVPPGPPTYRGQQVARFDTPKSPAPTKSPATVTVNEDALPEMPTWDSARTRRVEDTGTPHPQDMEMEPLNPVPQSRERSPSVSRSPVASGNGSFIAPPARTNTASSYYPDPQRFHDNMYAQRSPGPTSPPVAGPLPSPYDEPYGDYPYGMSPSPAPDAYTSQQYTPMPSAITPGAAYTPQHYIPMPTAVSPPQRQPSPGIGMALPYRQPSPGPLYRQPSPGPFYRQPSPGLPYRQPSPGPNSLAQVPIYRGMPPTIASPTSPPPPFSSNTSGPSEAHNDPGRPPSLLQSGRKPMPTAF